jgi:hypothetical protein
MTAQIWEGALAPEAIQLLLGSPDVDGEDLSLVTDVVLIVRDPEGSEVEWTPSDWDFADGVLTITFVFHATTSELTKTGTWVFYAKLTVPTGTVRSRPRQLLVRDRFYVPAG